MLLSPPFNTQTKWRVITGAPCSGKTTLLNQLAEIGFQTAPEIARAYFETEIAKGKKIEEIRKDDADLQRRFHSLQMKLETGLPTEEIIYLDRAIPDAITFYRLFNIDPTEILRDCFHFQYASIFILDRIPTGREHTLGPEDESSANFLDQWLQQDYHALGYRVVRVPALPPEESLTIVLKESRK